MKYTKLIVPVIVIILSTISCNDESITEPEKGNNEISGTVKFIDETPAASAIIQLKNTANNRIKFDTTDTEGNYKFDGLLNGNYILVISSNNYEINSYVSDEIELNNNNQIHDIFITYKLLDDWLFMKWSSDVFFIKFHPDNARIGDNFDTVEKLTGYYSFDRTNSATLNCEIYLIPNGFDWTSTDIEVTPEYVKQNFEYLMDAIEESDNTSYQINFIGDEIPKILSNPSNGFAFVKKDNEDKELKIPCVDRSNNDFGLLIYYK